MNHISFEPSNFLLEQQEANELSNNLFTNANESALDDNYSNYQSVLSNFESPYLTNNIVTQHNIEPNRNPFEWKQEIVSSWLNEQETAPINSNESDLLFTDLDEIQPSQFGGSQPPFNNDIDSSYHTTNQNNLSYGSMSYESYSNTAMSGVGTMDSSKWSLGVFGDPNNPSNQCVQNENSFMNYSLYADQKQQAFNQSYFVYNPYEVYHTPFQDCHLYRQRILDEQRTIEQERLNKKIIAYQRKLMKLREKEAKTYPIRIDASFNNFHHKPGKKRGRKPKNEKRVVVNQIFSPHCLATNEQVNSEELVRSTSNCSLNFELENFAKTDHFNRQF